MGPVFRPRKFLKSVNPNSWGSHLWGLFCVRSMGLKLRPRLGRAGCLPLRPLAHASAAGVREKCSIAPRAKCIQLLWLLQTCGGTAAASRSPARILSTCKSLQQNSACLTLPRYYHHAGHAARACAGEKRHRHRGPSKALANCTGFEQSPPRIVAASLRCAPARRSFRGLRSWLALRVSCVLSPRAGTIVMHRVLRTRVLPKDSAPPMKTSQG